MPKNNFISQFFIPHFAFLTNFAFKNRPVWNNTLTSSTWSPNESYNAVDQVIRATHRRPHILCSDEFNLRQWNLLHDRVCGVESVVLLGVYPRYRATPEQGPTQKPSKDETLCAEGHQPTTCKLCLNIEQWKTTSCLPSKQCVGWFLDFVITSWSEFLKIFTFKALGRGACLVSPYFGNDLNLGLYHTLKRTISSSLRLKDRRYHMKDENTTC